MYRQHQVCWQVPKLHCAVKLVPGFELLLQNYLLFVVFISHTCLAANHVMGITDPADDLARVARTAHRWHWINVADAMFKPFSRIDSSMSVKAFFAQKLFACSAIFHWIYIFVIPYAQVTKKIIFFSSLSFSVSCCRHFVSRPLETYVYVLNILVHSHSGSGSVENTHIDQLTHGFTFISQTR